MMVRVQSLSSSWQIPCLIASILVNLFFLTNLLYDVGSDDKHFWNINKLSWSRSGAAEAEAVASTACSGHGRAYLDGVPAEGKPVCECNTCFQGSQCSEFIPNCAADADSGDPLFLEPYWMKHAASSALVVSGWHRMSYSYPGSTYISQELEKLIRKVHETAQNAKTDGKYILFGAGSTQLLNAAVFALSMADNATAPPAKVVAASPYYPLYKQQTNFFENGKYEWAGDARSLLKNTTTSSDNVDDDNVIIEFVTSPNNPDGQLREAVLRGHPSVATIHDHAYYWPHFTPIPAPADEDVMIFTISKLTGHAGSRFGWAIVKDEKVYEGMSSYMSVAEMGLSRDTQLRVFQLLRTILRGDGKDIFNFAYNKMRARWENMTRIVSLSNRFSLHQEMSPQYCNFFQKVRGPSPAYAWMKCEREEDADCNKVLLEEGNIIGREGTIFDADARYVRLSFLKGDDDFGLLLDRLNHLISMEQEEEDGPHQSS